MQPEFQEITEPYDPRLAGLSALMDATFRDPNTVLGLDRMREFLAANRPDAPRRFYVVVVVVVAEAEQNPAVVAGCVFSYVVHSNCGFSEYMLADPSMRGRGIGRRLYEARKAILDTEARRRGHAGCRGVFIEVEHPHSTPPDFAALERETALESWQRLSLFSHLGFRHVDVPYVQPPLAPGKASVDYLDLLFAAWDAEVAANTRIPTEWVFDTLELIWSAWSPNQWATHLSSLKARVRSSTVPLLDLLKDQPD